MTHSSYPPNAPAAPHAPARAHPAHDDHLRPPPASERLILRHPDLRRFRKGWRYTILDLRDYARTYCAPGVIWSTDATLASDLDLDLAPLQELLHKMIVTKMARERLVEGVRRYEFCFWLEPRYAGDLREDDGWDRPTPVISVPLPPGAANGHKRAGRPRKWTLDVTPAEAMAYSRACRLREQQGQPYPDRDEWTLAVRAAKSSEDVNKIDAENGENMGEFPNAAGCYETPRAPDSAAADSYQSQESVNELLLTADSESASNLLTADFLTAEAALTFTPEQIVAERHALIAAGVNEDLAADLVGEFGVARCARYRAWLPFYDGVERPGGFLADAIRAGNAPPGRWLDKRKREIEQARAAERKRKQEAAAAAAAEAAERQDAREGAFCASLDAEERRRFEEDALERLRTLNKEAYRRHQQDPSNPGMMARAAIEKARAEVLREWMAHDAPS